MTNQAAIAITEFILIFGITFGGSFSICRYLICNEPVRWLPKAWIVSSFLIMSASSIGWIHGIIACIIGNLFGCVVAVEWDYKEYKRGLEEYLENK